MNYMCCKCKDIFSANNDNEVVWSYNMPVCNSCNVKGIGGNYNLDSVENKESDK